MMTGLVVCVIVSLAYSIISSPSTIKMVVFTSALGSMVAISMFKNTSDSWFPLVFTLILLGGIMVLFSIISSIEPNKFNKGKLSSSPLILILLIAPASYFPSLVNPSSSVKLSFLSPMTSAFLAGLILGYFAIFTLVISTETGSLRSA